MQVKITVPNGAFENAFGGMERTLAKASKAAVVEMSANIKQQGRANILAGGLGKKMANAYRVNAYPKGRNSINAAAMAYSKVKYADVFEQGAAIGGNPLLWLPLSNTPLGKMKRRIRPKDYFKKIGQPLYSMNIPGKPPMLGVKVRMTDKRASSRNVSMSMLKRGRNPGGKGTVRLVPLFVGVKSVKLRDRTDLRGIADANAAKLPALFFAKLDRS